MFKNVGEKIKIVSQVMTWICIVAFILGGFGFMLSGSAGIVAGLVMLLVGPLFAWIGGLFLYGFGQLIENTDHMVTQQPGAPARRSQMMDQRRAESLRQMDRLLEDGLITEEDYQQKLDQM